MVRARAVSAAVAAERARRKLSPETGNYLVASRLPANGERRCQDPARYRGGPLQKIYTGQASVLGRTSQCRAYRLGITNRRRKSGSLGA